jgi:hypothetical protein
MEVVMHFGILGAIIDNLRAANVSALEAWSSGDTDKSLAELDEASHLVDDISISIDKIRSQLIDTKTKRESRCMS